MWTAIELTPIEIYVLEVGLDRMLNVGGRDVDDWWDDDFKFSEDEMHNSMKKLKIRLLELSKE